MAQLIGLLGYALVPIGLGILFGVGVALVAAGVECLVVAALQPDGATQ